MLAARLILNILMKQQQLICQFVMMFIIFLYYEIFLITAFLYVIGVVLYGFIINEYEHKQKSIGKVLPVADELSID